MEFLTDNWPLILAILAGLFFVWGLVKKVIKLAIMAGLAAVGFFIIWPLVSDSVNFLG